MEFLSFHNIKNDDDYADMNTLSSSIRWILDHEALSRDVGEGCSNGSSKAISTSHGVISWMDFVKVNRAVE
jgi:hypothetical protein